MLNAKYLVSAAALLIASAGAAAAFPATATTDLNVRSGPGTNYSVVDRLQAGETVDVTETRGSWYQIAGGGWASGNYLDARGEPVRERVVVQESYPSYYGDPLFYYSGNPYFWDDAGYYYYWGGGRRHRVGWDFFRNHRHNDFRWTDRRHRDRFEDRWQRYGDRGGRYVRDRDRGDRSRVAERRELRRELRDRQDDRRAERRDNAEQLRDRLQSGRASAGPDRADRVDRGNRGGDRFEGRGGRGGGGDFGGRGGGGGMGRGGDGGGAVFPDGGRGGGGGRGDR
jgi:uncharacterized protein YraI